MDYRGSGVDINTGNEVVRRIKELARATRTAGVLSDLGSFGGLFRLDTKSYREPVLVSSADGVGTKLRLAFLTGRHDTVGVDLVHHCVNDILVLAAEPLFFLDYLAVGRLSADVAQEIVGGIARACRENACALLGGETAEMPGFYADGEYDLAGFIVGVVEKSRLIDGSRIRPGDRLIGLASSGLHTNGYSLARQILFERLQLRVDSYVPELGTTVGDALLRVHRSYLRPLRRLLDEDLITGMAHITGGGITENLPRILPPGTAALVDHPEERVPRLFRYLQAAGKVSKEEMYRTFNMGVGMIVACRAAAVDRVLARLNEAEAEDSAGEPVQVLGEIVPGEPSVRYINARA